MNRIVCSMLALAAVLAVAPSRAMADEALPPEVVDDRPARDHASFFGLGMHATRIRTEEGWRMGMSGPALAGGYFIGRENGFMLRGEMSFPVHGQMNRYDESHVYSLRPMYDAFRLNFDALFMYARRLRPTENIDVVLGAGIHVQTIRLVSSRFNAVEAITGGFGGVARVERRFGRRFYYAGEMMVALDPLDFIKHQNRIVVTFPMTASFMMGIRR